MSSTNRGGQRLEHDQYYTPAPTVASLLEVMKIPYRTSFLEPCRGMGAIYDQISVGCKYWAEIAEGIDYLTDWKEPVDLIVTNPPFSLALEFLSKSLDEARSVFYLLPLNFLGSKRRKEFWNRNSPSHVMVLSQRPCFAWACEDRKVCKGLFRPGSFTICPLCGGKVKPQTDSIEYAWFGWDRQGFCNLPAGISIL